MNKTSAPPLSIKSIREYALRLRRLLGINDKDPVNVPKLYDKLASSFEKVKFRFEYKILPDNSPEFEKGEEGYTDMETGRISIRESVFEKACTEKNTRAVFTLTHELGHFFLHYLQGSSRLHRLPSGVSCPIFMETEWQANIFASEFLMPFEECIGLTSEEIMHKFNVSKKAAEVRFQRVREDLEK